MKNVILLLVVACAMLSPVSAESGLSLFSEVGARVGFDAESRADLVSYEAFGIIDQDWSWNLSEDILLDLDIATAIGGLSGEGETAVYGHIGLIAEFSFGDLPISLILSSGPSLYSEDTFDDYDIGGNIQFTSAIGFEWQIDETWAIGYRFQHTSNADLNDPNPGLDMHAISLSHSF